MINITPEIKQELSRFKTSEELLRSGGISLPALDRAAFGFSDEDIKTLMPSQLNIKWKDDLANVLYEIQKSGLSKKQWAVRVDLSQPIEVAFEKNRFYIEDGHHRYYAAKILNKPLNVDLTIEMNPIKVLAPKLGYDEFHRQVFNEVKSNANGVDEIVKDEALMFEVKVNSQPRISKNLLYHVSNIKNYQDIYNYGLLPQFGETIQQAYGGYYNLDGGDNNDNEDDDYDQPQELDFDGLLFFSEKPLIGYSQTMQQGFKWEEVLLCVVYKNDTIYHKVSDYPKFTDYQGQEARSINGINAYDLPMMIETGDWFSFEEQSCEYLLYGEKLKLFIQKYFPDIYEKYS